MPFRRPVHPLTTHRKHSERRARARGAGPPLRPERRRVAGRGGTLWPFCVAVTRNALRRNFFELWSRSHSESGWQVMMPMRCIAIAAASFRAVKGLTCDRPQDEPDDR
jgi:hypothetical protein